MFRFVAAFSLVVLTACSGGNDLDKPPVPLGNFALGHNVVLAPNLVKGPVSREATKEEWIEGVKNAVDARFSRYDGEKLYHLGISVEGYVLAQPGIPVVLSPKSAVVFHVTVWDDAAGKKLNEKPEQLTALEGLSGETVIGSGLTQSREVQLENLSKSAAKAIEVWLVDMNRQHKWFGGRSLFGATKAKSTEGVEDEAAKAAVE